MNTIHAHAGRLWTTNNTSHASGLDRNININISIAITITMKAIVITIIVAIISKSPT